MTATAVQAMIPITLVRCRAPAAAANGVRVDRGQHGGDLAHLGRHPGGGDDRPSPCPASPRCSGTPCSRGRPGAISASDSVVGILGDGCALPGERRLLRLEGGRPHDAPVRRHDVARLDQHDVAGHESTAGISATAPSRSALTCGTCSLDRASTLALALSSCRVPSTMLNRIRPATMSPVETSPISDAHHGDADEHEVHRVAQLAQRHRPHRRRLLRDDGIGTVLGPGSLGLGRGQPDGRVRPQTRRDLGRGQGVRALGRAGRDRCWGSRGSHGSSCCSRRASR